MATGKVLLGTTGKVLLSPKSGILVPANGKVALDPLCPDARPKSYLYTISGISLTAGCLTGTEIPAGWSAQWEPGASLDISGCVNPWEFRNTRCCYTAREDGILTDFYGTGYAGLDVWPTNAICLNPALAFNCDFQLNLERVAGGFTANLINATNPIGTGQFTGPSFAGSVTVANCLDPFTIVNTQASAVMSGGQIDFTPVECSSC